jgi:hypothetical protein
MTEGDHRALIDFLKTSGREVVDAAEKGTLRQPEACKENQQALSASMGSSGVTAHTQRVGCGGGTYFFSKADVRFQISALLHNPALAPDAFRTPQPLESPMPFQCANTPVDCKVARLMQRKALLEWNELAYPWAQAQGGPPAPFKNKLHQALVERYGKQYHFVLLPIFLQLFVDGVACSKNLRVDLVNFLFRVVNLQPELLNTKVAFIQAGVAQKHEGGHGGEEFTADDAKTAAVDGYSEQVATIAFQPLYAQHTSPRGPLLITGADTNGVLPARLTIGGHRPTASSCRGDGSQEA